MQVAEGKRPAIKHLVSAVPTSATPSSARLLIVAQPAQPGTAPHRPASRPASGLCCRIIAGSERDLGQVPQALCASLYLLVN